MFYLILVKGCVELSSFSIDINAESELGKFLDQFLYNKNRLKNFERVTDKKRQFLGCDVIFESFNQQYIIDEKGYLSRPTIQDTFILELCYFKGDSKKLGWLFDSSKITTHYLFCWADRENVALKNLKQENIQTVEAWLINKKRLLNYLDTTYQINLQTIDSKIDQLLNSKGNGPMNLNGCTVIHSKQLAEKPLNIVMRKTEYLDSGSVEGKYLITKHNFHRLP